MTISVLDAHISYIFYLKFLMFQIQFLRLKCKLKITVNCFTYLIQILILFVFFPTVHDLFFNGPRSVCQRSAICFDLRNNIGRQIRSTTYLNSVGLYTSLSLFSDYLRFIKHHIYLLFSFFPR